MTAAENFIHGGLIVQVDALWLEFAQVRLRLEPRGGRAASGDAAESIHGSHLAIMHVDIIGIFAECDIEGHFPDVKPFGNLREDHGERLWSFRVSYNPALRGIQVLPERG